MMAFERSPLVSFVLLAFNQERFIKAAVEAVLGQDYEPLEIVISDDASTDRTYSIIQETVSTHRDRRRVIVNKMAKNVGLGVHLQHALSIASGQYVVIAAGDDLSAPERTRKSIEALLRDGEKRLALHCRVMKIDVHGVPLGLFDNPFVSDITCPKSVIRRLAWLTGSSVTLHRDLVNRFPALRPDVVNEDMIWAFRCSLFGGAIYIEQPLVRYRVNVGVSSLPDDGGGVERENAFLRENARRRAAVLAQMVVDIESCEGLSAIRRRELLDVARVRLSVEKHTQELMDNPTAARMLALAMRTRRLREALVLWLRFGHQFTFVRARKQVRALRRLQHRRRD